MNISAMGSGWGQQSLEQMRQAMFQNMDTDGDGTLSKSEFEAGAPANKSNNSVDVDQIFSSLDTNQDGVIDEDENNAAMEQFENNMKALSGFGRGQDLFARMDTDGDGTISKSEFEAASPDAASGDTSMADKIFSELDTNQDGVIDADEDKAAREKMAANMPPPPPPPDASESSSDSTASGGGSDDDDWGSTKSALLAKLLEDFARMLETQDSTAWGMSSSDSGVNSYA